MFADYDAEQVHAATARRWDLDGVLPVARPGWLACPVCRATDVQTRFWRYHERSGRPTVPGRCDVAFKCCSCAAIWIHGVALTEQAWAKARKPGRQIHWRTGRRLLEEGAP